MKWRRPLFFSISPKTVKMSSQTALISGFSGKAPIVTFDGKSYTIAIFRKSGGWLKEFFSEHILSVCSCREEELSSFERNNIKGPAAPDGILYYIRATPHDGGAASFIVLESEHEAIAMGKAVQEAEDAQDYLQLKEGDCICCTFCGKARSLCYEDHGD